MLTESMSNSLALYKSVMGRTQLVHINPFEPLVEKTFDMLKLGMVVIDVGSALGYYAIRASRKVGRSGKVFAVEPDPDFVLFLIKNLEMHNANYVVVIEKALSDRHGCSYFCESCATSEVFNPFRKKRITVETETLDNLVMRYSLQRVDLIKIDAQGDELAILQGAFRTLERFNPTVVVEIHTQNPLLLRGIGYSLKHLYPKSREVLVNFGRRRLAKKIVSMLASHGYSVRCVEGLHILFQRGMGRGYYAE